MWLNNKKVTSAFASNDSQWAWANIDGIGWRRVKDRSIDGVANIFMIRCTAKAKGRPVNVELDTDNMITTAYLL